MTPSSSPSGAPLRLLAGGAALAVVAGLTPLLSPAALADTVHPGDVVINEVYGGGGNNGAPYSHDFVELRNTSDHAVSLEGWSLQYSSAAGSFGASNVLRLSGSVPASSTYLIQLAKGAGDAQALPTPDATGTIAASGTSGVFALSDASGTLACTAAACGSDPAVIDLVGWGAARTFSGSAPAPATTNATSVSRVASTGENSSDFTAGAPTPTPSSASPTEPTTPPTDPTAPPTDPTTPPTDPTPPTPSEVTPISAIQGTGAQSPLVGTTVTTEGVVTAVYATGGRNGYIIQTGGTGGAIDFGTHHGSTAVFVHSPATVGEARIGQTVRVTGTVAEFHDSTQLTVAAGGLTAAPKAEAPVVPATVTAIPTAADQRESLEHMLVAPQDGQLTVTDVYATNKYGEISLAIGGTPLRQVADVMRPGPAATQALAAQASQKITLDDGRTTNFQANPTEKMSWLTPAEPVRVGSHPHFTAPVVLTYSFDQWRLEPTQPWTSHDTDGIDFENTRRSTPAPVGGDLQVGTFNVLNYFTTLGVHTPGCQAYKDMDGRPTSVKGGCQLRGAWDETSFARQQGKIVEAISTSGNDVVGLMEIENSARLGETPDEGTASLVAALNERDGAGTWAFVPTAPAYQKAGEIGGQDVITSAIIYKPAMARPVGDAQVLVGDPAFSNAREPLAQQFVPVRAGGSAQRTQAAPGAGSGAGADAGTEQGAPFLFVVNHFKSKGSGDADDKSLPVDPVQGNARMSRLRQAKAMSAWVGQLQSSLGVHDVLLGGDFNAYTQEEPLQVLYGQGYQDVGSTYDREGWSYSYGGAVGSLDHVLANKSAAQRLTGATDWSINGPESPLALYSRYRTNAVELVEPGPFAASDHNPLIVGMRGEFAPVEQPTDPTTPPVDPSTPPVDPSTPPVDPSTPPVDPSTPPVDPSTPPVDPSTPPVDPSTPPVDPSTPPVDPSTPPVDPSTPPVDPSTPPVDPSTPPVDPSTPPVDPSTSPVDPSSPVTDPTAPSENPSTPATDPGGTDGPAPGSDPGNTGPGTTTPGSSDPGTSDPGSSDPGSSEPGSSEPGSSEPGAPGSDGPGSAPDQGGNPSSATGSSDSASPTGHLPRTGAEAAPYAIGAAVLLILGLGALGVRRHLRR